MSGFRVEGGLDRGRAFQFTFDGRPVQAYPGESIAAALMAAVGFILLFLAGARWRYILPSLAGVCAIFAGAVMLIQRLGSAANLNIHLHCLVLDGVYRRVLILGAGVCGGERERDEHHRQRDGDARDEVSELAAHGVPLL